MDRAVLDQLYRSHGPAVLRRARQILQDEAEARDALQEIFLSLADHTSFTPRDGNTAWFYIRTTNYCLNRLRDDKNRARLRSERLAPPATSALPDVETTVMARGLLERLPAPLAEVAVYYYCDEMTQEEIAALLGCSRRHVGHLVERIRAALGIAECG
jgi:RNA polymerase sigma factor (sigma-70 family)